MTYVDWYGKGRWQSWRTPRSLFDPLHARYRFDLDGASDGSNGLLGDVSTPDQPVSWVGRRVFCNPPWSNITPFVEQAAEAELAVLLVPARTNSRWFHRALELGAVPAYFLGRPKFEGRPAVANSPVDCLFLMFERRRVEIAGLPCLNCGGTGMPIRHDARCGAAA